MIHRRLPLKSFREEFNRNQRLFIEGFLEPRFAARVYRALRDLDAAKSWCTTVVRNPRGFSFSFGMFPLGNANLPSYVRAAGLSGDTRRFLERSLSGALKPGAPLRELSQWLDSAECHRLMAGISGLELAESGAIQFASRYGPGDYNGTHDDRAPGRRLAFVLNLTRNWSVHWGGSLVMLDRPGRRIVEAYTPLFNSLALFKVPAPHAVLPVALDATAPRYAISGWFLGDRARQGKRPLIR